VAVDPALPPNLAALLADLTDRVKTLESSNHLLSSSILGGSFSVLDVNGAVVLTLGALIESDGTPVSGISAAMPSGTSTLWIDSVAGTVLPMIMAPMVNSTESSTTSATFASFFTSVVLGMTADSATCWIPGRVDAGTVGEVRLHHNYSGGASTSAITLTSTTSVYAIFDWRHGVPLSTNTTFTVEARRVSGAGSVYLSLPPTGITLTGHQMFGATVTGL
jgi:hypothetical protein